MRNNLGRYARSHSCSPGGVDHPLAHVRSDLCCLQKWCKRSIEAAVTLPGVREKVYPCSGSTAAALTTCWMLLRIVLRVIVNVPSQLIYKVGVWCLHYKICMGKKKLTLHRVLCVPLCYALFSPPGPLLVKRQLGLWIAGRKGRRGYYSHLHTLFDVNIRACITLEEYLSCHA